MHLLIHILGLTKFSLYFQIELFPSKYYSIYLIFYYLHMILSTIIIVIDYCFDPSMFQIQKSYFTHAFTMK